MRVRSAAWTLAWLLALAGEGLAEEAGVLPLAGGDGALLDASLGRAIAAAGAPDVLGPVEVEARLARDPEIAAALLAAREAVARSREHELQMRRAPAIREAEAALARLARVRARWFAAELVSRAATALALAHLLQPAEPERATAAFRLLLELDPDHRPEPGQLPPRAAQLLEQTRQQARPGSPPSSADLGWLAARAGVRRLVAVRLRATSADLRTAQRLHRGAVRRQAALTDLARLVIECLGQPLPPVLSREAASAPSPVSRRWYQRWWVWAIATAVVGGAVAASVVLTRPSSDGYDLRFHFR